MASWPAVAYGAEVTRAARAAHYADFYDPSRLDRVRQDPRPLLIVVGNCQAEAIRMLLDGPVVTLRVPPVHELTTDEVPLLHKIVGAADILVTQPVRDGYRGLALGARELRASLGAQSAFVKIPILRETGVFPEHAVVRDPLGQVGDPPLVPYHHLGLMAEAAGFRLRLLDRETVLDGATLSLEELRRREKAHRTIAINDVVAERRTGDFHTLNHPGNRILVELSSRVRSHLGISTLFTPPRNEMLGSVVAPVSPLVADVFDVSPSTGWIVDGHAVAEPEIREAHLRWYERHPRIVESGLRRHRDRFRLRGMPT